MNQVNGSTFYIDTAHATDDDDYLKKNALVAWVSVTTTAANGRIVLGDSGSNNPTKIDLRVPDANRTVLFHFRKSPMLFPNGIKVLTLANAVATAGITQTGS